MIVFFLDETNWRKIKRKLPKEYIISQFFLYISQLREVGKKDE